MDENTMIRFVDELQGQIDKLKKLVGIAGNAEIWKQLETSKTATGASVSITDAAPVYASSVKAALTFTQSGSGTPAPDNVRAIVGNNSEVITLNGDTITISLGDTYYSGSFDITKGIITIDKKMVDLGSLTWTWQDAPRFRGNISDIEVAESRTLTLISDIYQTIDDGRDQADMPNYSIYNINTHYVGVTNTDYNDAAAFKTAMSGHYVLYPLATPVTIQLKPTQIKLLKGSNTISASTGNITITYQPDNVLGNILGQAQEFALNSVYIAPALDTGDKIADFAIGNNSGVIYETPTPVTRTTAKKKTVKED